MPRRRTHDGSNDGSGGVNDGRRQGVVNSKPRIRRFDGRTTDSTTDNRRQNGAAESGAAAPRFAVQPPSQGAAVIKETEPMKCLCTPPWFSAGCKSHGLKSGAFTRLPEYQPNREHSALFDGDPLDARGRLKA